MNLSGKPKEFVLSDIEETNGEPVKVGITPLSPAEVDEIMKVRGDIDMGKSIKVLRVLKEKGMSRADLANMKDASDEEVENMLVLLGDADIEIPNVSVRKRTATETYNILKKHIVSWSGVFDDNGKSVSYSKETRELFLTALPAIVKDKIVAAIEHLTQHGVLPGEENSSPI
jgi:hypothetical protein